MAYDTLLADRVRAALSEEESLRERKMFGGLAFMVRDKIVACVGTGRRALLLRVAGDREAEYVQLDGAEHAVMGKNRSMGEGWLTVDAQTLTSESALEFWIDAALEHNVNTAGT